MINWKMIILVIVVVWATCKYLYPDRMPELRSIVKAIAKYLKR